jgi:hypothetical protein
MNRTRPGSALGPGGLSGVAVAGAIAAAPRGRAGSAAVPAQGCPGRAPLTATERRHRGRPPAAAGC